ncbi:MAG: TatD family nuclease-associated radical SAM protein [bacterium]
MAIAYEYRPGVLYLNVTNRCSNDCGFCVRQAPDYRMAGRSMRLEREPQASDVLKAIAQEEESRGGPFDEVVFCGFGEPTYRWEVVCEVGRALRGRGVPVRLNTNGQPALILGRGARELVAELAAAVDTVSISLNAPDAAEYEALCEPSFGAEAYPAVLTFARQCVQGGIANVVLTVVGFTLDGERIERCEELAAELGAEFRVR